MLVSPEGCPKTKSRLRSNVSLPCDEARGRVFNNSGSASWHGLGNYTLGLEKNLGFKDSAIWGLDTFGPGLDGSLGDFNLSGQAVATIQSSNFYVGLLGLGIRGANLSDYNNPLSSPLSALKSQNKVPSLSWAYTAGAKYSESALLGLFTACRGIFENLTVFHRIQGHLR